MCINSNEFEWNTEVRIQLVQACISNNGLNSPPIYRWLQLAKYVYSSQCNMNRATNEPPLAARFGINSFKEVKTTLQIIQFRSNNS